MDMQDALRNVWDIVAPSGIESDGTAGKSLVLLFDEQSGICPETGRFLG